MNMQLTVNVSGELAARDSAGFGGTADVLDLLAEIPKPEKIMALRPSPALQESIDRLLEKSRTEGLNAEEERQWRQYEYLEHLVRKAKINARKRLLAP